MQQAEPSTHLHMLLCTVCSLVAPPCCRHSLALPEEQPHHRLCTCCACAVRRRAASGYLRRSQCNAMRRRVHACRQPGAQQQRPRSQVPHPLPASLYQAGGGAGQPMRSTGKRCGGGGCCAAGMRGSRLDAGPGWSLRWQAHTCLQLSRWSHSRGVLRDRVLQLLCGSPARLACGCPTPQAAAHSSARCPRCAGAAGGGPVQLL